MRRETWSMFQLTPVHGEQKADAETLYNLQKQAEECVRASEHKKAIGLLSQVGEGYIHLQQFQTSLIAYKQLLRMEPFSKNVHKRIAQLFVALLQPKEAIKHFQVLSDLCEEKDQFFDAARALEQIDSLEALDVPARVRLVELYVDVEHIERAVYTYRRVLQDLEDKEYWSDYLKVADRLLSIMPDEISTRKVLARLYLERGHVQEALEHIQKAYALSAHDPEVLDTLILVLDVVGQEQRLIATLKELADLYEKRNEFDRAKSTYARVLERNPQNQTAIHALNHLAIASKLHVHQIEEENSSESLYSGVNLEVNTFVVESLSPEDTSKPSELEAIRAQLKSSTIDPSLLTDECIQLIQHRRPHLNVPIEEWPANVYHRLDGELLYEGRYIVTDFLGEGPSTRTFRAFDLQNKDYFVCEASSYLPFEYITARHVFSDVSTVSFCFIGAQSSQYCACSCRRTYTIAFSVFDHRVFFWGCNTCVDHPKVESTTDLNHCLSVTAYCSIFK